LSINLKASFGKVKNTRYSDYIRLFMTYIKLPGLGIRS
jgi:hypothetical protein